MKKLESNGKSGELKRHEKAFFACLILLLLVLVSEVLASTANRQPETDTDPAYYRVASNQSGAAPSDPSWAEVTHTEFASSDYTKAVTSDDSRTYRTASATIVGRWCAAEELFTFDLSGYSNIQSVYLQWEGYGTIDDSGLICDLYAKTAATTWTWIADINNVGDESNTYNDTTHYTASGIYKVAIFGLAVKVDGNTAVTLRTDYIIITVYYVATGGVTTTVRLNQTTTVTQSITANKILSRSFGQSAIVIQDVALAKRLTQIFSQLTEVIQSLTARRGLIFGFNQDTVTIQSLDVSKQLTRLFTQDAETKQTINVMRTLGFSFSQSSIVIQGIGTNRMYEFTFSTLAEVLASLATMKTLHVSFDAYSSVVQTIYAGVPMVIIVDIGQIVEVIQSLDVPTVEGHLVLWMVVTSVVGGLFLLCLLIIWRRRE